MSENDGQKILILEDEAMIRTLMARMLRGKGFDVLESGTGEDAIGRFEDAIADNDPFDLAILDLTLPGNLDGRQVLEKCLEMQPSLKAIIASGYADEEITASFDAFPTVKLLCKPYHMADLLGMVQQQLDGAPPEETTNA